MIAVAVIDDHPALLIGVTALLSVEPDIQIAAAGPSVRAVLTASSGIDVALLDLSLADGSRPSANIRALGSVGAKVIGYTAGGIPSLLREAGRAGVDGLVNKVSPA